MLIPFSLTFRFLLSMAVFAASGSFLCFQWFSGGLDKPGVLESQPGGVWTSLGMSEQFQITGS